MRSFFTSLLTFFSNKVIYAVSFLLAIGLFYYSKILSEVLHLSQVHGITSFLEYVGPYPEKYTIGLIGILFAVIIFSILTIASFKAFSDIHIILSVIISILCIIGVYLSFKIATLFINTFIILLIFSVIIIALISTLTD